MGGEYRLVGHDRHARSSHIRCRALWGDAGADTFTFAAIADAGDVIHDFNGSEDVFQFTASAFGGGLIRGGKLIEGQTLIDAENPVAVASKATFLFDTDTS
jgi:Ca2+-binding RTX toxin-like protein